MKKHLLLLSTAFFLTACSASVESETTLSVTSTEIDSSEVAASISESINEKNDSIYEGLNGTYEITSASIVDTEADDGPTLDSNTRAITITMNYTNTTDTPRFPSNAFQSDFDVKQEVPTSDTATVVKDDGTLAMIDGIYSYEEESEAYAAIQMGYTEVEPGTTVEVVVTFILGTLESWGHYSDTKSPIHVINSNRGAEKYEIIFEIAAASDDEIIYGQVVASPDESDWAYQSIGGTYAVTSIEKLTDGKKTVLRINMTYTNTSLDGLPIISYEAIQSDFTIEKESDITIEQIRFADAAYELSDEEGDTPAHEALAMAQENIKVGASVPISVKLFLDSSPGTVYLRNNTGQGRVGTNGNVYEKVIATIPN